VDFADGGAGHHGGDPAVDDHPEVVVLADHGGGLACVDHPGVDFPRAVRDAVRLMCAGAVLTLASVVIVLVTLGGIGSAAAYDLTAMQWPTVMLTQVGFWPVSAPVGAGLWL